MRKEVQNGLQGVEEGRIYGQEELEEHVKEWIGPLWKDTYNRGN